MPPWTIRACAILLGAYALLWAWIAFTGLQVLRTPVSGQGLNMTAVAAVEFYAVVALVAGAVMSPLLGVLAVFLWRGSRTAVIATMLPSSAVAIPLLLILLGEGLQVIVYRGRFDWQLTLTVLSLLLAGPGLVVGLLVTPRSRRFWAR